ncbi:uncharacterized protein LOC135382956 [Ornithodoros turicata]|uniref:uncharacterized protein LOC135382956 n=1 Tax=Ornithodoros turicata TaxID=34597 RepID=UPI003138945B
MATEMSAQDYDILVENLDDDELEALLFDEMLNERGPPATFLSKVRLNLAGMTADEARKLFRFEKKDLPRLRSALRLPPRLCTANGTIIDGVNALAVALRRLAYRNRLCDLEMLFGRHMSTLSSISNQVNAHIATTFGHLISGFKCHDWLNLEQFAKAVHDKGAPLPNCWGFIDGTARAICQPSSDQKAYFSGHKRFHCLKYQGIMCPNGIIVRLDGPYQGNRHDVGILRDSGLYCDLEEFMGDRSYVLYGDPAYPLKPLLQRPFSTTRISPEQAMFNKRMSSVRQAVEWGLERP